MIAPNPSVEYEFAITDIAAILCEVTTLTVISTFIVKKLSTCSDLLRILNFRVWDEADYVVPPAENGAFFITTNVLITPNQTQGRCVENYLVKGASCKTLRHAVLAPSKVSPCFTMINASSVTNLWAWSSTLPAKSILGTSKLISNH